MTFIVKHSIHIEIDEEGLRCMVVDKINERDPNIIVDSVSFSQKLKPKTHTVVDVEAHLEGDSLSQRSLDANPKIQIDLKTEEPEEKEEAKGKLVKADLPALNMNNVIKSEPKLSDEELLNGDDDDDDGTEEGESETSEPTEDLLDEEEELESEEETDEEEEDPFEIKR